MLNQDALTDSSYSDSIVRNQIIQCANADRQHLCCFTLAVHKFRERHCRPVCRRSWLHGTITALHIADDSVGGYVIRSDVLIPGGRSALLHDAFCAVIWGTSPHKHEDRLFRRFLYTST